MRITNLILLVITIVTNVLGLNEIVQLSLANLVDIETLDDISVNWKVNDEAKYEEGRIILTPKSNIFNKGDEFFEYGSLWSTKSPNNLESFTSELTIRSIGNVGITDAGISIFLIDWDNEIKDKSNFGGPLIFKGLQILINHDKEFGPVIRIYLNDGSKKINIKNDFIGIYKYEYQGANVPMTIKIGYNLNFFKITCDNKLLFVSKLINLSNLISNKIKIGVTAQSLKKIELHEQFEILRLITYDELTDEMKEDEDETLFAKHDKFLANEEPREGDSIYKELELINNNLKLLLKDDQTNIGKQFSTIIKNIDKLSINFIQLQKRNDEINEKLDNLSKIYEKLFKLIENFDNSIIDKLNYYFSKLINNETNFENKSLILILIIGLLIIIIFWVKKLNNEIKHFKIL